MNCEREYANCAEFLSNGVSNDIIKNHCNKLATGSVQFLKITRWHDKGNGNDNKKTGTHTRINDNKQTTR